MDGKEVLVDIAGEESVSPVLMKVSADKTHGCLVRLKEKSGAYAYAFTDVKLINRGAWIDIYENII